MDFIFFFNFNVSEVSIDKHTSMPLIIHLFKNFNLCEIISKKIKYKKIRENKREEK